MSRLLTIVALVLATSWTAAGAQDLSRLAPADEYFGRFQLSVLGIGNAIHDGALRIDAGWDPQEQINGPLSFAADAIGDWQRKYPRDTWIAKDLFALESAYLRTPAGRALAVRTAAWLARDYPQSPYAFNGNAALADAGIAAVPGAADAPAANPVRPPARPVDPWERFGDLRLPAR